MIEPIMYLALGFMIASVIALAAAPYVHSRAVRLTTRRLQTATPLSIAEIQADKDQLRADFAMSTRQLERSIEQLRNRTATLMAELGKKTDIINRLRLELGERTASLAGLESRERTRERAFADQEPVRLGGGLIVQRLAAMAQARSARPHPRREPVVAREPAGAREHAGAKAPARSPS